MSRTYDQEPHDGFRVRPYALTGGRTRPKVDLAFESIVVTTTQGKASAPQCGFDHQAILNLAESPISLAEISAHTHSVVGVTRVLVGDLVAEGMLVTHGGNQTKQPSISILERVLDGLQSL